jgi:hypothetical protein
MKNPFHWFRVRARRATWLEVGESIAVSEKRYICIEYANAIHSLAPMLEGPSAFAIECWKAVRPGLSTSVEQALLPWRADRASVREVRLMLVALFIALDEAGDLEDILR